MRALAGGARDFEGFLCVPVRFLGLMARQTVLLPLQGLLGLIEEIGSGGQLGRREIGRTGGTRCADSLTRVAHLLDRRRGASRQTKKQRHDNPCKAGCCRRSEHIFQFYKDAQELRNANKRSPGRQAEDGKRSACLMNGTVRRRWAASEARSSVSSSVQSVRRSRG